MDRPIVFYVRIDACLTSHGFGSGERPQNKSQCDASHGQLHEYVKEASRAMQDILVCPIAMY